MSGDHNEMEMTQNKLLLGLNLRARWWMPVVGWEQLRHLVGNLRKSLRGTEGWPERSSVLVLIG
jgi:hypothetical protein